MLMQLFARGQGKGAGPVEYVINENGLFFDSDGRIQRDDQGRRITYRRQPPPIVLAGNPAQTMALIDSLPFKHKYTSGVLSCAPDDGFLSPEKEQELIADFERVAFAGLNKDQYSILWVRHAHAGHHELHFIVPRVELGTGKSLNICPPGYQHYFDPWRSLWNGRENWADPDDPARAKKCSVLSYAQKITAENVRQQIQAAPDPRQLITDYLVEHVELGLVDSRQDVISLLKEADMTIHRQGKDYLSVRTDKNSKSIRLKGLIYAERIDIERIKTTLTKKDGSAPTIHGTDDRERLATLERELATAVERRAAGNAKRYQSTGAGAERGNHSVVSALPDSNRQFEEIVGYSGLGDAINHERESLDWHLRRRLGADAVVIDADRKPVHPIPKPEIGSGDAKKHAQSDRIKNRWGDADRKTKRRFFDFTEKYNHRNRMADGYWPAGHPFGWTGLVTAIGSMYDGFRTTITERIDDIIRAIRIGATAAGEINSNLVGASAAIKQKNRCLVEMTQEPPSGVDMFSIEPMDRHDDQSDLRAGLS